MKLVEWKFCLITDILFPGLSIPPLPVILVTNFTETYELRSNVLIGAVLFQAIALSMKIKLESYVVLLFHFRWQSIRLLYNCLLRRVHLQGLQSSVHSFDHLQQSSSKSSYNPFLGGLVDELCKMYLQHYHPLMKSRSLYDLFCQVSLVLIH